MAAGPLVPVATPGSNAHLGDTIGGGTERRSPMRRGSAFSCAVETGVRPGAGRLPVDPEAPGAEKRPGGGEGPFASAFRLPSAAS